MTYAPSDLLSVRDYVMRATGLGGDAVGIVGDPAHASTGGYHEGNDDLARVGRDGSDYSKRESSRDRPGSNAASALDIGDFSHNGLTLRALSLALVDACKRGDPRAADIREIIYTPDGKTVRRYDRLGVRSDGDSSHLYHTHLSFFRDSEGRRATAGNALGLLTELIEGGHAMAFLDDTNAAALAWRVDALAIGAETVRGGPQKGETMKIVADLHALARDVTAIKTALATPGTTPDNAPVLAALARLTVQLDTLEARLSAAGQALGSTSGK